MLTVVCAECYKLALYAEWHYAECRGDQLLEYQKYLLLRHLVVKTFNSIQMLFIFSTPLLIRHLWQLKTVVFLHRCLLGALLLEPMLGGIETENKMEF